LIWNGSFGRIEILLFSPFWAPARHRQRSEAVAGDSEYISQEPVAGMIGAPAPESVFS
jgi:hypothetical protein